MRGKYRDTLLQTGSKNPYSYYLDTEERLQNLIWKHFVGRDTGVVLCECDDCVRNAVGLMDV